MVCDSVAISGMIGLTIVMSSDCVIITHFWLSVEQWLTSMIEDLFECTSWILNHLLLLRNSDRRPAGERVKTSLNMTEVFSMKHIARRDPLQQRNTASWPILANQRLFAQNTKPDTQLLGVHTLLFACWLILKQNIPQPKVLRVTSCTANNFFCQGTCTLQVTVLLSSSISWPSAMSQFMKAKKAVTFAACHLLWLVYCSYLYPSFMLAMPDQTILWYMLSAAFVCDMFIQTTLTRVAMNRI